MNNDLEKYIQKIEKNPETGEDEIWLYNLPKDEVLISVFRKIKNKYHSNRLIIEDKIDLSGITINEEINFSNCIFNKEIEFWNTIFLSEVNFSNSKFLSKVNFCGVDNFSTIDFWGSEFFSEVYFSEGGFITLKQGFSSKIDFQSAVFKNLVKFSGRTFKDAIQFYNVNFENKVIFSNAVFEKEVQFLYCKVTSNTFISFEGATFKKCLDISRSNFHYCNLRFWNIKIEGDENLSQYEKYINDFDYKKVEPSVYAKIRETYRIIKNAFYKEDNRIEGLEFYKKEMDVYREELKNKTKKVPKYKNSKIFYFEITSIVVTFLFLSLYLFFQQIKWFYWIFLTNFLFFIISSIKRQKITEKNVVKTFKENKLIYGTFSLILFGTILSFLMMLYYFPNYGKWIAWIIFFIIFSLFVTLFSYLNNDKIILYLNKYSNNFGTNWVNGIVFILWVGMISYFLILISLHNSLEWDIDNPDAWSNTLKHFLEVINVTRWKDIEPFGVELNGLAYLFLFIGRIFIGYGYYQTIQAFRKYGKSS
ncbi:hypothetical protein CAPN001_00320 [Capnocytophaga stomatis]|uniref:pentapeptide repeat-containing protein n=1 Tax=Capnocytophaga stomatis TaxID=1848904 RepID=UPI00194EF57D|nr:pentapeptide repeat-containing protein [Capnocytophaga stomatis]GIJ95463.1 hypothetical protein CAPN001_00320 [Capnocytophaga stomatis]